MFFKKKILKTEKSDSQNQRPAFDQREKVSPLVMVVTIVNRNQANYFVSQYQDVGAALSMVMFGYSMPPQDVVNVLRINETRKDILLTFSRAADVEKMKNIAYQRFAISQEAKGVLFAVSLDGVSGISVYKYLSDQNREVREKKMNEKNPEIVTQGAEVLHKDKNEYSMVLAIVNKGNTDLVMEAARKAGAKGGTIAVARGTGNPELAKEYGIVIQPEKEMVFIVVPKSMKDKVMKAVYDEAGIATKGMGIVVSLPILDTVGLDGAHQEYTEEK